MKLFKKILVGAVCLLSVVGLAGCSTEGLSEEQVKTMFTTLEKSQTFMAEVQDTLDEKAKQDKSELDELKLQNELKQAEIDELTRQNDLKEQELEEQRKQSATPSKEEAYALFNSARLNILTNYNGQNDNIRYTVYHRDMDIDWVDITISQLLISESNGDKYYFIAQNEDLVEAGYYTDPEVVHVYAEGEDGLEETVLGYDTISGDLNMVIKEANNVLSQGVDSVELLDNGDLVLIATKVYADEDYDNNIVRAKVVINNDRLVDIEVMASGQENAYAIPVVGQLKLNIEYGVLNENEVMAEYNAVLGD